MTRIALLLAALCGSTAAAAAQEGYASATLWHRVEGDLARAAVEIEIEDGWHLYHDDLGNPDAVGKPTVVRLSGGGIAWGPVRFPEPERLEQPGLGAEPGTDTWIYSHEGTIVLFAAGRVGGGEEGKVEAELSGLTCEDVGGSCVPYSESVASEGAGPDAVFASFPADLPADGEVAAAETPAGASGAAATRPADSTTDYATVVFPEFSPRSDLRTHGLLAWLALAFLAGMILNVMPCVLPVISIKVLSFVQQAGEDRRRVLALGVAFAAGILTVFLALATLAAAASKSWGEQFQSPTFLVVMIGIVFAFALSLFGVFELGVPSRIGSAAGPPREGMGDAFFKGMLATVLATPCSGPFLGSTLTWTLAQTRPVIFAVFLALGLGMALPYVLLTAQPALLKILPRPGAWMETFKQSMGFVLLATVVYLMVSLRQDVLLFAVVFLVFVAMGCWWWGRFASFDQTAAKRLAHLAAAVLIVGAGSWISFSGLPSLFAPAAEGEGRVVWEAFDPERFEDLLGERSIFVDFTADWCPNCKLNERFVFDSPEVVDALEEKGVVPMMADITHAGPYTDMLVRLRESLGARSIPFLAVFPADRPEEPHVRWDLVSKDDFLQVLGSLPDPELAARGPDTARATPGAPGGAAPD